MKEFKNLTELTCNLHLIPEFIAIDVMKRIVDWLTYPDTSVGDDYIKRQLAYANEFIRI